MKILSILTSVKQFIPKLITRFTSIKTNVEFIPPDSDKPVKLKDSKDIAKARKNVKEALYIYIDTQFGLLPKNDILPIKDSNTTLNLTPSQFEDLLSRFYTELRPLCETFVTEKKMSPNICKFAVIVLAGLLIELYNEQEDGK